jgi:hypothetical protein
MAEVEGAKAPPIPNDVEEKAFHHSSDEHELEEEKVNVEYGGEFHKEALKFDEKYNPDVCVPDQSFLRKHHSNSEP